MLKQQAGTLGRQAGEAFGKWLFSKPEKQIPTEDDRERQRQQELERQHAEAERQRRARDEEEARQKEFERNKQELVGQMKDEQGTPPKAEGLEFKEESACEDSFRAYHLRESERRQTLIRLQERVTRGEAKKADLDWCKLHTPLYPSTFSQDCPADLQRYRARIEAWRSRCGGTAAPATRPADRKERVPGLGPRPKEVGEIEAIPKGAPAPRRPADRPLLGEDVGETDATEAASGIDSTGPLRVIDKKTESSPK